MQFWTILFSYKTCLTEKRTLVKTLLIGSMPYLLTVLLSIPFKNITLDFHGYRSIDEKFSWKYAIKQAMCKVSPDYQKSVTKVLDYNSAGVNSENHRFIVSLILSLSIHFYRATSKTKIINKYQWKIFRLFFSTSISNSLS